MGGRVAPQDGPVICNPGAGPVLGEGIHVEHAARNIGVLVEDLVAAGVAASWEPLFYDRLPERWQWAQMGGTRYSDQHDGRFPFIVTVDGVEHFVEMPGIPLHEVRYVKLPSQNIWDFPRLYVDGSSWVWQYALNVLADPQEA